ncbi:hypothetical protein ASF10_10445 [Flavobacterium sp. Leaf82]|jgi:hypothetical protein|uniref:hypothetical protein n=1 Tax=unclassified Flavobacterium TaxID=196869 RepID=UPI0006FD9939|nr:hypothetical protein [Flavobacterium sp. Leaf82]KQO22773.1 hypothetical protein ASF10_10445 [Flavobacterium sp. Leaf82]
MITIEDLIAINSKLSTWNLVNKYFSIKWKAFQVLMVGLGIIFSLLMFYFIMKNQYLIGIVFGFISFFLGVYFLNFKIKKERVIIEEKYSYTLHFSNSRNKQIAEIQKEEFKKIFQSSNIYEKDSLLFLIDCIRKENEDKKFKYPISVNLFAMIFGSLFFGSFLSGFVNFSDNKLDEYLYFYKIVFALIFAGLNLIFFIERTIVKEILDTRRKNRNRLIRILENIYIEKYVN